MNTKKARVTQEHQREAELLRQIWESATDRPKQVVFGEKYEVGSQSAVGQFLRGEIPLSLKAAIGFARGLGVPISAFSPRLAEIAHNSAQAEPVSTGLFTPELQRKLASLEVTELHKLENILRIHLDMVPLAGVESKDIFGKAHSTS